MVRIIVSNAITVSAGEPTGEYEVLSYTVPSGYKFTLKDISVGGEPALFSIDERYLGYVFLRIDSVDYRGFEARGMDGDRPGIYGGGGPYIKSGWSGLGGTFGAGSLLGAKIFEGIEFESETVIKIIAYVADTTVASRWRGTLIGEETPSGVIYEIFVNAASQLLATPAYETTYNIAKDAAVASQSLTAHESTFNISIDALCQSLAQAVIELVTGIIEIFKDALATAQATFNLESTLNIGKDAVVNALALALLELGIVKDAVVSVSSAGTYEITFTVPLEAFVGATALSILESKYNISQEASVKVQAEVSVLKPTELKVTRLFLVIGDLAIQIQGG